MLHRPDLPGSTAMSPMLDDYYYYMAIGDLTLAKNFFVDSPPSIEKPSEEEEENEPS